MLIVLPDAALGGGHAMNFRLATALNSRGWHVDIAFLFNRCSTEHYREAYPSVDQRCMGGERLLDRIRLPFRLAKAATDYDLIMAGLDLAATNYGYIASRLAGKPFLAWMHIAFNEHMHTSSWFARRLSVAIYRCIRLVVFPSVGARASLEKALGRQPAGAHWPVLENFNEPTIAEALAETTHFKRIFGKPVIMNIGRLVPQKALDRLVRAHARLLEQGIEHHLVFLGEGPQRHELEAAVAAAGVSATVFFPGHVPNPHSWLSHAALFALCSRYEGLPLVLLEALQAGIPIVSMDCPAGPREILADGTAGILTPAGDEQAFCMALAELLHSPQKRATYARRGLERAKFYAAERIVPLWEELLGKAAAETDRNHKPCQDPSDYVS